MEAFSGIAEDLYERLAGGHVDDYRRLAYNLRGLERADVQTRSRPASKAAPVSTAPMPRRR